MIHKIKCFRVPKVGEPPFEGNQRFEGYSVDLIEGISQVLGFKYELELVPDNKYGSYNKKTKTWDGLVKHLLDRVSIIMAFNVSKRANVADRDHCIRQHYSNTKMVFFSFVVGVYQEHPILTLFLHPTDRQD